MTIWYRNPVKRISDLKKTLWIVVIASLCVMAAVLALLTITIFPQYKIALVISVLYYILAILGYYLFCKKEMGRAPERVLIADNFFAWKNETGELLKMDYSRISSVERFNENLYVLKYEQKNKPRNKEGIPYLYWAIAEEIEDRKNSRL